MKKTVGWSEDLGSKLKALRLAHKVKQIDLARSLGISPAYLNLIENNKRPMHVDVLEKLLNFFEIDMDVFMSASEGAKLQNRLESILRDPFLQGHSLGAEEVEILGQNSSLSNLVFALYDGFKSSEQQQARMQQQMLSREEDREDVGAAADRTFILDRTAYDEVTEFLEKNHNYFPAIEAAAEKMLAAEGVPDGRRASALRGILKKQFNVEVVPQQFPASSHLLRIFNEKTRKLYVSSSFGIHRLHFQLAHFIGLMAFEREPIFEELIRNFPFNRKEAATLARVNMANYFAGALLLPYEELLGVVQRTAYDIRTMEGMFGMPFEAIAHRLCTLNKPGASGLPLHFIRTDIAGNISKKYSGTGIKLDDRRRSCPKWAVHRAFLTPSILTRQYSIMESGEAYFCVALATGRHDPESFSVTNAISVGIGCRAEDAHWMSYARGLKFENPERDGIKVGITCRLCNRVDCTQRALPSFKMEYEINTINRKENVLAPIKSEDLLLVTEEAGKSNGRGKTRAAARERN